MNFMSSSLVMGTGK